MKMNCYTIKNHQYDPLSFDIINKFCSEASYPCHGQGTVHGGYCKNCYNVGVRFRCIPSL